MKINLGNKLLNINLSFRIYKTPNFDKLKKELSDYFSNNTVEGFKIKDFEFDSQYPSRGIVPKDPCLEECLGGDGPYKKDLEEIGKKYGVENLGFIYWCYGK
jgi:hypothetical protein